jgi:hypothetical protein
MTTPTKPLTPADWWAALPIAQQVALLEAAPLIAGPWRKVGTTWGRAERGPYDRWAALVWREGGMWVRRVEGDISGARRTVAAAKRIADAELRAAGWRLM